ncbi:hypothetical protein, partial [Proteus mirabilis]|uniref:hypothetical protein n=1 Tax=Proteus mirabilis TaxID=584 RepID=UPI004032FBD7
AGMMKEAFPPEEIATYPNPADLRIDVYRASGYRSPSITGLSNRKCKRVRYEDLDEASSFLLMDDLSIVGLVIATNVTSCSPSPSV